jgi:hypothetical protein
VRRAQAAKAAAKASGAARRRRANNASNRAVVGGNIDEFGEESIAAVKVQKSMLVGGCGGMATRKSRRHHSLTTHASAVLSLPASVCRMLLSPWVYFKSLSFFVPPSKHHGTRHIVRRADERVMVNRV